MVDSDARARFKESWALGEARVGDRRVKRHAVNGCICAAAMMLAAAPVCAQERHVSQPLGAAHSELVYFPGQMPVRVVRGGVAPVTTKPTPLPKPPAINLSRCRVPVGKACSNVEVVSFGDGRGETVRVVRGTPTMAVGAVEPEPATRATGTRSQMVSFADPLLAPVAVIRGSVLADRGIGLFAPAHGGEFDRVAFAVEGVESGHGTNPRMWRPETSGPQGPMQVSAAAALDVGGGDRFDNIQNRLLGRAFLAHMYQRYGNWPDALAAYNWGPGNLDRWIAVGRPEEKLPLETARYIEMVLRDALVGRVRM
jgi:hypothetical protein